jgi:endoglucanase
MHRRRFLNAVGAGLAGLAGDRALRAAPATVALARNLPRWRGFNLLEKFMKPWHAGPFRETDFQWMAEWGFDFARLPMDYREWTPADAPSRLDEESLADIDQAVEWGRKYGVHVSLNLHRAPGYTVARPPEKLNLWTDEEAQRQFDFQWSQFARRYRDVPSARLSFDLVNEPAKVDEAAYAKVVRRVVAAIRREDPDRLIISDGLRWGREPIMSLADLGIAQSTRGYDPMRLSHYKASWIGGSEHWPEPTWPLRQGDKLYDRRWLRDEVFGPWRRLAAQGVGVHVGECGSYNKTPHEVVLRWMRDQLEIWQEAGFGWALWNLRGGFGIVNSDRADVEYAEFHGQKLDRKLLDLLRRH